MELPVATRHRRDMTEKLLKATLNPNTHTHAHILALPLIQVGQLSITGESMGTWYWLIFSFSINVSEFSICMYG